jgi:hypothetical protein
MKIDPKFKVRNIADENLLIMQSGQHTNMTKVISLNATALQLFNAFSGKDFESEEVVQFLLDTYGIESDLAQKDASSWISKLTEAGVILY